jgi:nucleoside-diphosphate-sugar epimerase
MNILLTGANGFLGKKIAEFLTLDHKLYGLSRSSGLKVDLSFECPTLKFSPDLVIHASGLAHVIINSRLEEDSFHKINVVGTENLLRGLNTKKIPKKFVFISSVSVYGETQGIAINEDSELKAVDPYGMSKIRAEQIVLKWCNVHNVTCTILRLPLVIAENPVGNLEAMIKGIQKGYYFNIAGGNAKKSMVLAEDVARSILKAADVGGIFNLTDGYHPSFAELSNHISAQLGKGKPMDMPMWFASIISNFGDLYGSKAPLNTNKLKKITSDLTFDDSRAREVFGWNPRPVLDGFKIN